MNLDQEEMSLNDISYLELWQPLCMVEQNHLHKLFVQWKNIRMHDKFLKNESNIFNIGQVKQNHFERKNAIFPLFNLNMCFVCSKEPSH